MIQFDVDKLSTQLQLLVQNHGKQAIDIAAQVTQVSALNELTNVPFYGGIGGIGVIFFIKWWKSIAKQANEAGPSCEPFGQFIIAALLSCLCLLFLGIALFSLCDVWMWVGLFNPQLALAHIAMQKLGAP